MGKNARARKEQKIIEKYGQLPPEPRKIDWGKIVAGLLVLALLVLGIRDISKHATKAYASWREKRQAKLERENRKMYATMSTTMGDIKFELFKKDAPKTVENFKGLAEKGYYNGVIFHRVIQDFMIQGGDPTGTGRGGESIYGEKFEDEINKHKIIAGTLAMANAGPNTNGSQFFIVTEAPQPHLDGKHTAFGQVIEGMDVVKKIAAVEVDAYDKPLEDVKITGIKIEEESPAKTDTKTQEKK